MIKSVEIVAVAKSIPDFKELVTLLESLGLRKDLQGKTDDRRYVEFLPATLGLNVIYGKKPGYDTDLFLVVSDPDAAFELAQKEGFNPTGDVPPQTPPETIRFFDVQLPGGTRVRIGGRRVAANTVDPAHVAHFEGSLNATGKRFALVVSRFNSFITERLLAGALDALARCGADWKSFKTIIRVPGAFEIPSAARTFAETKLYDAIICLGCLLRGDTAHYDVIVNEVTRGIGQSAQETGVPHAFGVLTCDTLEQAIDRAGLKMGNKGFEAALAAVEMANLKKAISHHSALSKKQIPRSARNDKSERARNDKSERARSDKSERARNDKPDRPRKRSNEPAKASKTKRRK